MLHTTHTRTILIIHIEAENTTKEFTQNDSQQNKTWFYHIFTVYSTHVQRWMGLSLKILCISYNCRKMGMSKGKTLF